MLYRLQRDAYAVGCYYRDDDYNSWATWSGPARRCADCDESITSGYLRSMSGTREQTHHCAAHVRITDYARQAPHPVAEALGRLLRDLDAELGECEREMMARPYRRSYAATRARTLREAIEPLEMAQIILEEIEA